MKPGDLLQITKDYYAIFSDPINKYLGPTRQIGNTKRGIICMYLQQIETEADVMGIPKKFTYYKVYMHSHGLVWIKNECTQELV